MLTVRPSDPLDMLVAPSSAYRDPDVQPYIPEDYIVDFDTYDYEDYEPFYDDLFDDVDEET